jgi:hypothetical protein
MTGARHLETSFIFVTPKAMKEVERTNINERTFGSRGEHITVDDERLAGSLQNFAMQEMAIIKLPVGANSHAEQVEFFWTDVKKNKKTLDRLNKILAMRWIELVWKFEQSREECSGNMLSVELNKAAADIEGFIKLRRFLIEGTDPDMLKKAKRSILLFHHSEGNAPQPE